MKKKSKNLITKGKYVKITVKNLRFQIYKEFGVKPVIFSHIDYAENTRGFLQVKFKRHRWYNSLLKTNDPLIFSIGFHKFQSLPYFCKDDEGERLRLLKYTPRYDYCLAVFYGNYVPNNTGVVCFQSIDEKWEKFRVSGTGVVLGFSQNYRIKKKLKLVGEPFKIYKNTALIKGMFNSDIEVAKFTSAKIRTVSGIRGQIKKAVKEGQEGSFRAAFEDKIIMSDLVFCRTWYTLVLDKVYNPIVSFDSFKLLKTTWELRKKYGVENKARGKTYEDVERPEKKFTPLILPKSLKKNLPFKTKEKIRNLGQKDQIEREENSVIKNYNLDSEKEAVFLIQRLKAIEKEKKRVKHEKDTKKKAWTEKWKEGMNRRFMHKIQKQKKQAQKQKYARMRNK